MKFKLRLLDSVAVGLCLIALLSAGSVRAERPTRTITGIVVKAEVHRGEVRSVYISDAQEGKFLVLRSTAIGKELLGHVGATVKATGYVKKAQPNPDFAHIVDVLHYEIVPPADLDRE